METIKIIDRVSHTLTSPLLIAHHTPDAYDFEFEYATPIKVEEKSSETPTTGALELEIDIKNEDHIFVREIKEFSEENHDVGEDFVTSDNDNDENFVAEKEFETDDSLPLEVTRRKKKKQKVSKMYC